MKMGSSRGVWSMRICVGSSIYNSYDWYAFGHGIIERKMI